MELEQLKCTNCGCTEISEYKQGMFVCSSCDITFSDPRHTTADVAVAPQFCEEGCGNPIKYKCALCGKMVCEGHGGKAKVLLARKYGADLAKTSVAQIQQAWCLECFKSMSEGGHVSNISLMLKDDNDEVRREASSALWKIGSPSAMPYLAEALRDGNSYAARVLMEIGGPSAVQYLAEALKDGNKPVRESTAYHLGEMGDTSAVPYLGEALKDSDDDVRHSATYALGRIGDPSAVPYLLEALKDGNERVRKSAAGALGEIGDTSAVPYLGEALKDSDYDVRDSAAPALGRIGDPSAVPYLVEALKDGNDYAPPALEKIGDPAGLAAVDKARKRWSKGKPYRG